MAEDRSRYHYRDVIEPFKDFVEPMAAEIRQWARTREHFWRLFSLKHPLTARRVSDREAFLRAYFDKHVQE